MPSRVLITFRAVTELLHNSLLQSGGILALQGAEGALNRGPQRPDRPAKCA
jgi:hypothetical protein